MTEQTNQTIDDINNLNTQDTLLVSGLTHHLGISLSNHGEPIEKSLNFEDQPEHENQIVPAEKVPITLEIAGKLQSVTGIAELIGQLRNHLLDLESLEDISIPYRGAPENRNIISLDRTTTHSLLENKASIINKYIHSQVRINLLLEAIDGLAPDNQAEFQVVREQLKNWQTILKEILPQLDRNASLQDLIEQETSAQRGENNQEVTRLKKLMSGDRASISKISDRRLENRTEVAMSLKQRVINVLLGNTATDKKEAVATDLATELFTTASVVNDIRIIDRLKKEEIDLLSMRNLVAKLKQEYQEDPSQAETLNQRLINEIAIPIANKIAKLFPHEDDNSPTLIASALYRSEAVCAGKSSILSTVFKLLGLSCITAEVVRTLDERADHIIFTANIFSSTVLIIDANYKSYSDFDDDEIRSCCISPKLAQKYIANRNAISPESNVVLYTASPTLDLTPEKSSSTQTGIYTLKFSSGREIFFKSSIPYPHPLITENTSTFMNSADHSNYASLLKDSGRNDEAEQHYLKAIEINPQISAAHSNYASLLKDSGRNDEAEQHYLKAIEINPQISATHFNYAILLEELRGFDEAKQRYLEAIELETIEGQYYAWYLTGFAEFLYDNNEIDYSLRIFQSALKHMKANPKVPNFLTASYIEMKIAEIENTLNMASSYA